MLFSTDLTMAQFFSAILSAFHTISMNHTSYERKRKIALPENFDYG